MPKIRPPEKPYGEPAGPWETIAFTLAVMIALAIVSLWTLPP